MVRHPMPCDDLALLLPGQGVENLPQMPTRLPENHFAPPFGDEHDMVFVVWKRGACFDAQHLKPQTA
jgi:hypothetical protein